MVVNKKAKLILEDLDLLNPITIIEDRYNGTYTGFQWISFNLNDDEVPQEVSGSDLVHAEFWTKNTIVVGMGNTPDEAVEELRTNILDS